MYKVFHKQPDNLGNLIAEQFRQVKFSFDTTATDLHIKALEIALKTEIAHRVGTVLRDAKIIKHLDNFIEACLDGTVPESPKS